MAAVESDKLQKKLNKLKRRSKRRYVISVIALVLVILVGGSFLAVLIHLQMTGLLSGAVSLLRAFLIAKNVSVTLVVFWILAIPLVLIVILVINFVRKIKFKSYKKSWEETAEIAIEQEKRDFQAEQEKLKNIKRFGTLNDIRYPVKTAAAAGQVTSFKELCENFRKFAAYKLGLYYSEEQVRKFIAGLATSRIMILQGMSGTGKTSLAYAFGEYISNPSVIVPVQPMWKDRSDILGYFNEFTKKYNETLLLKTMYEANGSNKMFLVVLDEMNIARVEYYFAEFLSLLEIPNPELRYLEVVPDVWENDPPELKNGRIKLPENMWFLGTANNDDSTFAISDKVYDRAMILNLETRSPEFECKEACGAVSLTFKEFIGLTENARNAYEITRRNERRLKELDEYLISKFRITFGNRIMRQIRDYIAVYVACGGDELEALDDILCKKVLRKLAYKDLTLSRKDLAEAANYIETLFGADKMPCCREYFLRAGKT